MSAQPLFKFESVTNATNVPYFNIAEIREAHSWNKHLHGGVMICIVPEVFKTDPKLLNTCGEDGDGAWNVRNANVLEKNVLNNSEKSELLKICLQHKFFADGTLGEIGMWETELSEDDLNDPWVLEIRAKSIKLRKVVEHAAVCIWNDLVENKINPFAFATFAPK